jgi:E3 ubiquitin-protein ligase listerin
MADASTSLYQPRDATLDLLSRQIATIRMEALSNTNDLYPLLAAQSESIQQSVYSILHHLLPKAQEQISFEVALSKIAVSLPDELLSLLLEPPEIEKFSTEEHKSSTWIKLRTYLLSWKLVFDHFTGSVRCQTVENPR